MASYLHTGVLTAKKYTTSTGTYSDKTTWDAIFTSTDDTREYTVPSIGISWKDATSVYPSDGLAPPSPIAYYGATYIGWSVEGYIYIPTAGTYSFACNSDDGYEVKVDGIVISSHYAGGGGYATYEISNSTLGNTIVPTSLTAGWHTIIAKMNQGAGAYCFALGWLKPGDSVYSNVPASNFGIYKDESILTAYPHSSPNNVFGNAGYVTSSVGTALTYYNYSDMAMQGYATINSITNNGDGTYQVNVTINAYTAITRGNNGYAVGTYTFQTTPTIKLYNVTLASSVTVYNSALTTTVADATTGSITHSSTVNVSVPASWVYSDNSMWEIYISQVSQITTVSFSQTNETYSTKFKIVPIYAIWVRKDDALYQAKEIWVRKDDTLMTIKSLNVDVDGVIK